MMRRKRSSGMGRHPLRSAGKPWSSSYFLSSSSSSSLLLLLNLLLLLLLLLSKFTLALVPTGTPSPRRTCATEWRPSVISHAAGAAYCARLGGRLCSRAEYCPRGRGTEPLGGFRAYPSAGGTDIAHGDGVRPVRQWAPTSDGANAWVMLSNVSHLDWPSIGVESGMAVDPPCALAGESDLGTGRATTTTVINPSTGSYDQVGGEFNNYTVLDPIPADKPGGALVDQDDRPRASRSTARRQSCAV
jgi:hypothetical protein